VREIFTKPSIKLRPYSYIHSTHLHDMDIVSKILSDNPPPSKRLSYGTAGFRDRADLPLTSVLVRVGALVRQIYKLLTV
jgi:hypothetical protein